jgi:hypothetical protein
MFFLRNQFFILDFSTNFGKTTVEFERNLLQPNFNVIAFNDAHGLKIDGGSSNEFLTKPLGGSELSEKIPLFLVLLLFKQVFWKFACCFIPPSPRLHL